MVDPAGIVRIVGLAVKGALAPIDTTTLAAAPAPPATCDPESTTVHVEESPGIRVVPAADGAVASAGWVQASDVIAIGTPSVNCHVFWLFPSLTVTVLGTGDAPLWSVACADRPITNTIARKMLFIRPSQKS
jgi:hypothetical protein